MMIAPPHTSEGKGKPEKTARPASPRPGNPRASRRPVRDMLPEEVMAELQREVGAGDEITTEGVAELDQRLGIAERYGVSRRRLRNHLQRLRKSRMKPPENRERSGDDDEWKKKCNAHRRRQVSVAAILDHTFGRLAECDPGLWDRRAYLMLVGTVYERLATSEGEISNEELVALAKILAENRRADARQFRKADPSEPEKPTVPAHQPLPDNFADIVRQVYGTNFQMPGHGETPQAGGGARELPRHNCGGAPASPVAALDKNGGVGG